MDRQPLIPIFSGGILGGFIGASMSLSLAGLVFSGPLSAGLGTAITGSLLGGGLVAIVTALSSKSPGHIAGTQDSTAAVIAAAATGAVARLSADNVSTGFAIVVVATGLSGVAFWVAGRFRLGRLLRFIPHPVILGFIAASGMLILVGAVAVLGLRDASDFDASLPVLLPGLSLGLALFVVPKYLRSPLIMPGLMMAWAVGIHMWVSSAGTDSSNTFLGPFSTSAGVAPLAITSISSADWLAVLGQSSLIATVVVMAVMSYMLNAAAVETSSGIDASVDDDMPPLGIANIVAAIVGSLPAFLLLSDTEAVTKVAGPRRATGVIAGLFHFAMLIAGVRLFTLIPTAVVGGILVFIALNFFEDALWLSRHELTPTEIALVATMGLATFFVSFGLTIALGLVAAIVLFVARYARLDVVRRIVDVVDYPGLVDYSAEDQKELEKHRGECSVISLGGFLFFGTANRVVEALASGPDTIVLDLRLVTGIDTSAKREILRHVETSDARVLSAGHPWLSLSEHFDDIESAVTHMHQTMAPEPQQNPPDFSSFDRWFATASYAAGEALIAEGDERPGLFVITDGAFNVVLDVQGETATIRTMGPGDLVGEMSLYGQGSIASASVVATESGTARYLSADAFDTMANEDPASAARLHQTIANVLADRLRATDNTLRSLRHDLL